MTAVDPEPHKRARPILGILRGVLLIGLLLLGTGTLWAKGPTPGGESSEKKDEQGSHPKKPNAMEHVKDSPHWEILESFGISIHLPKIFGFQITRFMVYELIAALLVMAIYIPLAHRAQSGDPPRGWWDNTFEVLLTFVRNDIARPAIGEHDADRFVPFLWTMFLFILFSNLLGMIPFGGSPTASIYVTGALALCVFFAIHGPAIAKMGFFTYLKTYWPDVEVPFVLGLVLKPLVFVLELIGVLVRNVVLAVRLFANMFAGHMVIATLLTFIALAGIAGVSFGLWTTITVSSILGIIALSLLEIFVAFLQTYIFVFLAAIFMGMAMHPEH
jgi:F-type H+-transporting ATPase subunit a